MMGINSVCVCVYVCISSVSTRATISLGLSGFQRPCVQFEGSRFRHPSSSSSGIYTKSPLKGYIYYIPKKLRACVCLLLCWRRIYKFIFNILAICIIIVRLASRAMRRRHKIIIYSLYFCDNNYRINNNHV